MSRITNQESRIKRPPRLLWFLLAPVAVVLGALWPRAFAAIFMRKP